MTATDAQIAAARPRLLAFALSLLRDRDQAEDLAQTALLKMLAARESFSGSFDDLVSWGCKIAQNHFYSQRALLRSKLESMEPAPDLIAPDNPEARLDLVDAVRRLDELSAKRRNALVMFAMGEDYDAIQRRNRHKSRITAKTSVSKGKVELAAALDRVIQPSKAKAECAACGSVFVRLRCQPKRRFCSRGCADRSRGGRISVTCNQCGAEFKTYRSFPAFGRGKFCTVACANEAKRQEFACETVDGITTWSRKLS